MNRRNYIAIAVVIGILIFDLFVYKYQTLNCPNINLIRCFPTGEIYPFKDSMEI